MVARLSVHFGVTTSLCPSTFCTTCILYSSILQACTILDQGCGRQTLQLAPSTPASGPRATCLPIGVHLPRSTTSALPSSLRFFRQVLRGNSAIIPLWLSPSVEEALVLFFSTQRTTDWPTVAQRPNFNKVVPAGHVPLPLKCHCFLRT